VLDQDLNITVSSLGLPTRLNARRCGDKRQKAMTLCLPQSSAARPTT